MGLKYSLKGSLDTHKTRISHFHIELNGLLVYIIYIYVKQDYNRLTSQSWSMSLFFAIIVGEILPSQKTSSPWAAR